MISVLLITVCASVMDCRPAQPLASFSGPTADYQCQSALIDTDALVKLKAPRATIRLECQTDPHGGTLQREVFQL